MIGGYVFSGYNTPASDYRGRLRIFESDADPWVPCRNVWNQFNYFIVNVNDDLSIPAQQLWHHLEFPAPGTGNRPFNRYLSQRPLLNEDFQTFLPVPDATAGVEAWYCSGDLLEINLKICNTGSHLLPAGTPVTFYNGDPTSINTDLIDAGQYTDMDMAKDSCAVFSFKLPRINGSVFGVVNDNGTLPYLYMWSNGSRQSEIAGVTADQSNLQFFWTGPQGMLQEQATQPATQAGQYAVTATNTYGCTAFAVLLVEEDKVAPLANAGPEQLAVPCGTASVTLDASGSSSGALFSNQWTGFQGNIQILDTSAIIASVQESGTYIHQVINLRNGCTASDTVLVQWENPIAATLLVDSITCYGENDGRIRLTGISGGSPPYQYSIDGVHLTNSPNFFNLSPGVYPVQIRDPFGCQWSEEVALLEPEEIRVSLPASDSVIQLGQTIRLEAVPAPAGIALSGIIWQPSGLPYQPMSLQQTLRQVESTEFTVQIFDLRGCTALDRTFVRVDNYQIYAPNVIYPGRDFNDAFTIFSGDGLVEIRLLRIFDRWGGMVFERQNFSPNELAYGWDGTYRGEPVNPGVFAWYAEVLMRNGQVRLLKGDVTVLR